MEKVFTNLEHAAWLKEQSKLHRPYWYGTYHLPCTEKLLQRKKSQYPSHYTESRMPTYRQHIADGQICGDCVNGAIKGAIWSELGKRSPVYASHGCPDTNADGMFQKCKDWGMDWGPISTIPDEPGIAVRFSGHVGVTIGDGEVVEWRGFAYGCVTTELKKRKWTHWYRLPWTDYVTGETATNSNSESTIDVGTLGARLLKNGCKGSDVKTLQELLMKLGFTLPKYGADSDFGDETEAAVKQFQKKYQLVADGKYGPKSHGVMMEILAEMEEDEDENEEEKPTGYVNVTGGTVNVRKGASTKYDIVTVVRKGTKLPYSAIASNGWYYIEVDGISGWISNKYTEVVNG